MMPVRNSEVTPITRITAMTAIAACMFFDRWYGLLLVVEV
jgi:hypothetical protein